MSNSDPKELTIKTIAEIVNFLISSYEKGEQVNLNFCFILISSKSPMQPFDLTP